MICESTNVNLVKTPLVCYTPKGPVRNHHQVEMGFIIKNLFDEPFNNLVDNMNRCLTPSKSLKIRDPSLKMLYQEYNMVTEIVLECDWKRDSNQRAVVNSNKIIRLFDVNRHGNNELFINEMNCMGSNSPGIFILYKTFGIEVFILSIKNRKLVKRILTPFSSGGYRTQRICHNNNLVGVYFVKKNVSYSLPNINIISKRLSLPECSPRLFEYVDCINILTNTIYDDLYKYHISWHFQSKKLVFVFGRKTTNIYLLEFGTPHRQLTKIYKWLTDNPIIYPSMSITNLKQILNILTVTILSDHPFANTYVEFELDTDHANKFNFTTSI